jgi:aminopeptidase N
MEPIAARRVFPSFDEPGFKTPFDITVISPTSDKVVSNTLPTSSVASGEGRTKHQFERTLPLPTYLLAFAVGPFDIVEAPPIPPNAVRKTPLPFRGVSPQGQGAKLDYAMRYSPEFVNRLEAYLAAPFPYQKLDLIAGPNMPGAMENAGAIIFNSSIILLGADASLQQQTSFAATTAHEIAHQWFGDLVTPVWWTDIWLNEAFADWMAAKIVDQWRPDLGTLPGRTLRALGTMELDSQRAGRPIREPIEDSARIMSAFDAITYQKGAGVLAMIESYIGEDKFQLGVQRHLAARSHGNAEADDFFKALADAANQPAVLEGLRTFVNQPGVPLITVKRSAAKTELQLSQSRYKPLGSTLSGDTQWTVPFCLTAYSKATADRQCTLISGATASLTLKDASAVVMPNAQGAGYYRFSLDEDMLNALLARSSQLPAGEALSEADSLAAGFAAGKVSLDKLIAGARALATHENRYAALSLGRTLMDIHDHMLEPAQRAAFRKIVADIYRPRLTALGVNPKAGAYANTSTDQQLLRASLVNLVVFRARDPQFRKALADAAVASLTEPAALDTNIRESAWSIAAENGDPAFIDALRKRFTESNDTTVRRHAGRALAFVKDPKTTESLRALALDERVSEVDAAVLLYGYFVTPENQNATWDWFEKNSTPLLKRLSPSVQIFAVAATGAFCDAEHRARVEKTLKPIVAELTVGDLELARSLEQIDLCVAQKNAHRAEFASALK